MRQCNLPLRLVGGILIFSFILLAKTQGKNEDLRFFSCNNGIPVIAERLPNLPLVHVVLALRSGSKYEKEEEVGLSHLLEHLILFSDDNEGASANLSEALRLNGAMVNGHTGRDLVTFEITLPADRLPAGISLIRRLVFDRKFSDKDLERERAVVRRERKESRDDPVQRGTRLLLRKMFPHHPYGRSIYGSLEDLDRLSVPRVEAFYRKYFTPDRCSLSVVGDVDTQTVESVLNSGIGSVKIPETSGADEIIPPPKRLFRSDELVEVMDIHQAHIFVGFLAPPYNHEHRIGIRVIAQMLGRGIYPLLSSWLVGRFHLVSSASMSYLPLAEMGCVWVHMVLDPENIKRAKNELFQFIKQFRSMNFSLQDYPPARRREVFDFLESSMNQLRVRSESGRESGIQRALSYARFILINRREKPESFEKQLKRLSPSKLRSLAGKYLLGVPHTTVVLLPRETP